MAIESAKVMMQQQPMMGTDRNENEMYQLQDQMNHMDLTPPQKASMEGPRYQRSEDVADEHMNFPQFDLQETKRKLKEIFIFYASYGDRLNTTHLKSNKFHKMLQDAKVLSGTEQ